MQNDVFFYFAAASTILAAGGGFLALSFAFHAALQECRHDRVPVLLYHRLVSQDNAHPAALMDRDRAYVVYDSAFAEQMDYIAREGYNMVSLDDFLAYQEGRRSLPQRPIMVTFDDGFESNYQHAFPILKKYGMSATIFVTPDPHCENFTKHASVDSPLTHAQLREMSQNGISIQSHGMTHRYLTELEPGVVFWELIESKKFLQRVLGRPVDYLAIPSGAYSRTVRRLAKEAGYKAVFCMLKGTNNKSSDRYALRRLVIGRDFSISHFRRILCPSTGWCLRMKALYRTFCCFHWDPAASILCVIYFIARRSVRS